MGLVEELRKLAYDAEMDKLAGEDAPMVKLSQKEMMENMVYDAITNAAYADEMNKIAEDEAAVDGVVFDTDEELIGAVCKRASDLAMETIAGLSNAEELQKQASVIDEQIGQMSASELSKYAEDIAFGRGVAHGEIMAKEAAYNEAADSVYTALIYKIAEKFGEDNAAAIDEAVREDDQPLADVASIAAEEAATAMAAEVGAEELANNPEAVSQIEEIAIQIGEQVAEEVAANSEKTAAVGIKPIRQGISAFGKYTGLARAGKSLGSSPAARGARAGITAAMTASGKAIGSSSSFLGLPGAYRSITRSRGGLATARRAKRVKELLSGSRVREFNSLIKGNVGANQHINPADLLSGRGAERLKVFGARAGVAGALGGGGYLGYKGVKREK